MAKVKVEASGSKNLDVLNTSESYYGFFLATFEIVVKEAQTYRALFWKNQK